MPINSKKKGSHGELEISHILNDYGYNTRRSAQFNGLKGDADVIGLPNISIECKRVEKLNVDTAMEQSIRDCKGKIPCVFHRKNRKDWLVTMRLSDWIELYRKSGLDEQGDS